MTTETRWGARGQSTLELALALPLLLVLIAFVLGVMLMAETATELRSATALAAAAASGQPVGAATASARAADATFRATLHGDQLVTGALTCRGGNFAAATMGTAVTCDGSARLDLAGSPLAILWRGPLGLVTFRATGRAVPPAQRSCQPQAGDAACAA